MAFNINERVKWAYPDPNAKPDEMVGKITGIAKVTYFVRWDNGSEEECEEGDLEYEDADDSTDNVR